MIGVVTNSYTTEYANMVCEKKTLQNQVLYSLGIYTIHVRRHNIASENF